MKKRFGKKLMAILLVIMLVFTNCLTIFAQDAKNGIPTKAEATQKLAEETEKRDYINVSPNIVAKHLYNGTTYTEELLLTKSDFTSANVFLKATQGEQNVTFSMDLNNISEDKDASEKGYIFIGGTYPTGTAENPVNYVLTLKKDVTFTDENGVEIATIPMTFTTEFNFWMEDMKCFEFNAENQNTEVVAEKEQENQNTEVADENKTENLSLEPTDENKTDTQNTEMIDEEKEPANAEVPDEVNENNEEQEIAPSDIDEPIVIAPVTWKTEEIKTTMILTGRDLKAEEFKFEFVDSNGTVIAEGKNAAAKNGEAAEILFASKDITYDKVGEYTYMLREVNNKLGGVTYDTTSYKITVVVSEAEGGLSKELVYPENGITFTNNYNTTETEILLNGTTTLNAGDRKLKAEEFTFSIIETDKDGKALENAIAQKAKNNADGKFSFKLAYALKDVGTHYYKVTETDGKETGMTYATKSYIVTVEVKDNGDGTLSAVSNDNTKLDFVNKYEADGSVTIQAKIELKGRTLKNGEFQFKLEAATKDAPMPTKVTATNKTNGTITFEKIAYDEEDIGKTYDYRIVAVKSNHEKMTYDNSKYTVKVTITDKGNAKLEIKQSSVPTFQHVYGKVQAVKTGDNTLIPLYGMITVICAAVIILSFRKIKKDSQA